MKDNEQSAPKKGDNIVIVAEPVNGAPMVDTHQTEETRPAAETSFVEVEVVSVDTKSPARKAAPKAASGNDAAIAALDEEARESIDPLIAKHAERNYYYPSRLAYYHYTDTGKYIQINEQSMMRRLRQDYMALGFSKDELGMMVGRTLRYIQDAHHVDAVTEIAGFPKGWHTSPSGQTLLVTKEASPPLAIDGNCDRILGFIERLLGEEQSEYLLGALAVFVRHLRDLAESRKSLWTRQAMSAIAIAGPVASGKTLLMTLIAKVCGGRTANPYRALCNTTGFNGDIVNAEIHINDDEVAAKDYGSRKNIASGIKNIYFANETRIEGKYQHPYMVPLHSMLFFALNDTPDSLMCLPAMDSSLNDKLTMLKTNDLRHEYSDDEEAKSAHIQGILNQVPMFRHYLLEKHVVRRGLRDSRTGVKTFRNLELMAMVNELSPDTEILELLFKTFLKKMCKEENHKDLPSTDRIELWKGRSHQLLLIFETENINLRNRLRQLFPSRNSLGLRLRELAERFPEFVVACGRTKGCQTFCFKASVADYWDYCPECLNDDLFPKPPEAEAEEAA